ncbi:hypothetical protein Tco_0266694 [Tanacetum coccineum]
MNQPRTISEMWVGLLERNLDGMDECIMECVENKWNNQLMEQPTLSKTRRGCINTTMAGPWAGSDFDADPRVPLILGRSFLKTGHALIDVYEGELTLRVGKEAVTFNLDQTSRYSSNYDDMTANRIDVIKMACEEYSQEVPELKVCKAKNDKSSIDEPPEVKLKDLPPHLEYAFLEGDDKLPVIIAKDLSVEEKRRSHKV